MQDPDRPKPTDIELLRRLNEIAFRKLSEFTKKFEQLQEYERAFQERAARIRHRHDKHPEP